MIKNPRIQLADTETCPTCDDEGMITCDHDGTGRDEDGWCTECSSPTDQPGRIMCSCIN